MSDATLDMLHAAAETLTGRAVSSIEQAAGGGNSRIYKVIAGGAIYALKRYPVIENDPRDRLGTERMALQLFETHGIGCTPRWIAAAPPFALMEWVEGKLVTNPEMEDIEAAISFLKRVFELSGRIAPGSMPPASEACISGAEILRQINQRLKRLSDIARSEPLLGQFLTGLFMPALADREAIARQRHPGFDVALPAVEQRLIPADFGFHNVLRTPDNRLVFIDFEYFGWDDPVKVVSDFLLHPAMMLDIAQRQRFHAAMMEALPASAKARFHALYPLFGLRWTLILLNEFLPERWQARKEARGEHDAEAARKRQLEKARAMLARSAAYED